MARFAMTALIIKSRMIEKRKSPERKSTASMLRKSGIKRRKTLEAVQYSISVQIIVAVGGLTARCTASWVLLQKKCIHVRLMNGERRNWKIIMKSWASYIETIAIQPQEG